MKSLHARILVTSQILSRFLADCTYHTMVKIFSISPIVIQSQKLVKWQHSYHAKVFTCLKIDDSVGSFTEKFGIGLLF